MKSRAISSQAIQECMEGSTTRPWSPDRTVKAHERAATKVCKSCFAEKGLNEFSNQRNICKACRCASESRKRFDSQSRDHVLSLQRASYQRNKHEVRLSQKAYYESNKDKVIAQIKRNYEADPTRKLVYESKRYASNREHIRAKQREYRRLNVDLFNAKDSRRRAAEIRAIPGWANFNAIREIYRLASEVTSKTGILHVVDHEVPLRGKTVCGLHVAENLRVISNVDNLRKSNKHAG